MFEDFVCDGSDDEATHDGREIAREPQATTHTHTHTHTTACMPTPRIELAYPEGTHSNSSQFETVHAHTIHTAYSSGQRGRVTTQHTTGTSAHFWGGFECEEGLYSIMMFLR